MLHYHIQDNSGDIRILSYCVFSLIFRVGADEKQPPIQKNKTLES
ncbi:hypothetical protein OMAG_001316 [Candidatus Omnitrophus magneticus]|uniref:Uncharacterized protein n=1 Tax=Candidatus Omnitrophus magneticus TaxID=1609969 RepID=A0A0F0CTQ9_9BACT|nr:hypothetical protein OMAG_001316 [Candidatus Omnitrophus magneticus]